MSELRTRTAPDVARAVRDELSKRGLSIGDLSHAQQTRVADHFGMPVAQLRHQVEHTFTDEELYSPMLRDDRVWSEVQVAEHRLGTARTGTRVERWQRVTDELARLHKLAVDEPAKVDRNTWEAIKRYERRLRNVERWWTDQQAEASGAMSSLQRQAAAELAAAKLGQ